jgi:hypothetical protein
LRRSLVEDDNVAITITVKGKSYESTTRKHAEEVLFGSGKHRGDFEAEMNGWPCTDEARHDCHALFIRESAGRTITLTVTGDKGGYAKNHGLDFGATGTITYDNGNVTYG